MTKAFSTAACLCLFLLPFEAHAENSLIGEFSANAALTSDYVFRGISQSDEHATIQAGFDWTHPLTGLYAGVWGSGVDFEDASVEVDFYGGLNGSVDKLVWDVGAIYYSYPGADESLDYDFWELAVATGYDFDLFSLSAALNYSPEFFGDTGSALYPALYATVPLPYDFTLSASAAYQWIEDGESYADWSLGLDTNVQGFGIGLKYHDTDLDEPDDCADGCDERLVLSLSKTF
jgi:uncharacterized protein (TIGR02001 family)